MKLLVTAGPTREPLDPVRFLSNGSSGRMGYAIAAAAAARGHDVLLITGPVEIAPPAGVTTVRVVTAMQLLDACLRNFADADALIMTAAVCDYRPAHYSQSKLKKEAQADLVLRLVPNPDVLATLGSQKTRQVLVGFALETDDALASARRKLKDKHCDALVLNAPASIGSAKADFTLLTADGGVEHLGTLDKSALADRLLELIEKLLPTE
jgi:phosphopantothenoylcysteine decarboxylase/phosphopantothenate--cysteine ligase